MQCQVYCNDIPCMGLQQQACFISAIVDINFTSFLAPTSTLFISNQFLPLSISLYKHDIFLQYIILTLKHHGINENKSIANYFSMMSTEYNVI